MSQSLRAIYKDGQLRFLEPLQLVENQRVRVNIEPEEDDIRAILGDLLVPRSELPDELEDLDEAALIAEIREGFKGVQQSVADIIIEERQEEP